MAAFLNTLSNLFTLTFVITSMLAMGLSLTMPQILAPLRNGRLVALALAANLVVVPATGFLLSRIIPLDADLQIGLILFGCAAGAPTLPKLAQIAKADIAFAVGLMALLVVATVVYLPLVLPLLLPGVSVDAGKVALTLFLEMLAPLGIGLLINARYKDVASALRQPMMQISNISLALLLVLVLGLNLGNVLGLLGSGAIIGIVVLIAVALGAGYLLGGPRADTRQVLAIGTGERGVAAAFVIATGNFADRPDVLVFLAAGLIMLGIVMPLAAEVGRRSGAARTAPAMAPEPERVLTTAIRQEGAPDAPAMG
jgi:BASS family bile acid:Na+ symporter